MPRIVEVTVPADRTASLLSRIGELEEIVGLRLESGTSKQPPGDVVVVAITDWRLPELMQILAEMGLLTDSNASITTSRPDSIVSTSSAHAVTRDTSRASWEELEALLNRESSMTLQSMLTMGLSGFIAAFGLLTNALHVVLAAMVIAPGFEPVSRVALGLISRSLAWRRGLEDVAKGYLALVFGAAVATWLAQLLGVPEPGSSPSYLPDGSLLAHWQSISAVSLLVSTAAGLAGAILIMAMRSVLTAGVMIGLALVPAAAFIGMGAASGDAQIALAGLLRLSIEMGLVLTTSLATFAWKRLRVERRRMAM